MSKLHMEKLFLCSKCRDNVQKNASRFMQTRELENKDADYECDICGALGKLYFCIAGYEEEVSK